MRRGVACASRRPASGGAAFLALVAVLGCGIKAPPRPPLPRKPAAAGEASAPATPGQAPCADCTDGSRRAGPDGEERR